MNSSNIIESNFLVPKPPFSLISLSLTKENKQIADDDSTCSEYSSQDEKDKEKSSKKKSQGKYFRQFFDMHGFHYLGASLLIRRIYVNARGKKVSEITWCIGQGKHSKTVKCNSCKNPLYDCLMFITNKFANNFIEIKEKQGNQGQYIALINANSKSK